MKESSISVPKGDIQPLSTLKEDLQPQLLTENLQPLSQKETFNLSPKRSPSTSALKDLQPLSQKETFNLYPKRGPSISTPRDLQPLSQKKTFSFSKDLYPPPEGLIYAQNLRFCTQRISNLVRTREQEPPPTPPSPPNFAP